MQTCKDPQKADTALKKYWQKERLLQYALENPEDSDTPVIVEAVEAPASKKRQSSVAPCKAGPKKKAKVKAVAKVVALDSDSSEDDEDDEKAPPSTYCLPKRDCRKSTTATAIDNLAFPPSTIPAFSSVATAISGVPPAVPAQSVPLAVDYSLALPTQPLSSTPAMSICRQHPVESVHILQCHLFPMSMLHLGCTLG